MVEYHNHWNKVIIKLKDEQGKKLQYDRCDVHSYDDHRITLLLKGINNNFSESELHLIMQLIDDRLNYGNNIEKTRMLLKLYDKIDECIKRK